MTRTGSCHFQGSTFGIYEPIAFQVEAKDGTWHTVLYRDIYLPDNLRFILSFLLLGIQKELKEGEEFEYIFATDDGLFYTIKETHSGTE